MNVKRLICMLLSAILVLCSAGTCLADEKSVELILPQGDIYTNKAEFTVSTAGGNVEKFTYYLDGEQLALGDEDGKLIVSEALQLPSAGNHILKVVAEFEGGQKAEDSKSINVYHKVIGAYRACDFNEQKLTEGMSTIDVGTSGNGTMAYVQKETESDDYYANFKMTKDELKNNAGCGLWLVDEVGSIKSFKSGTARLSFDIKISKNDGLNGTSEKKDRLLMYYMYDTDESTVFVEDRVITGVDNTTGKANLNDGWNHIEIVNYRDESKTKAPERAAVYLNGVNIYEAGGKIYSDGNQRKKLQLKLTQTQKRDGENDRAEMSLDNLVFEQSFKLGISKMSYLKNDVWTDFSDGVIPNDAQKIKVYFLDAFNVATLTSVNISMSSKSGVKTLSDKGIEYNALEKSIIFTPDNGFIAGEDIKITMSDDTEFYSIDGEGPFPVEKAMEISFSTSVEDNISEIDLSVDSASVSVTKGTSSELKDMILIIAAYNAGELTALQTEAIDVDSLAKGETKKYDVALADNKGGTELKAFLWDSLSLMTPIKIAK